MTKDRYIAMRAYMDNRAIQAQSKQEIKQQQTNSILSYILFGDYAMILFALVVLGTITLLIYLQEWSILAGIVGGTLVQLLRRK